MVRECTQWNSHNVHNGRYSDMVHFHKHNLYFETIPLNPCIMLINIYSAGVFGVLYTVSKEKSPTWAFVAFRSFIDWLQLFLLLVNPQYGYGGWIDPQNT